MIELLIGFAITLISLLIGFQLGKNSRVIPEQTQKKINQIFNRVVTPKSDVGAVSRPTVEQNYYRDNPQIAKEHGIMDETLDILNTLNQ